MQTNRFGRTGHTVSRGRTAASARRQFRRLHPHVQLRPAGGARPRR